MKDSSTEGLDRGLKPSSAELQVQRLPDEHYRALEAQVRGDNRMIFLNPVRKSPLVGTPRRTPFGMLAPALMELFGLQLQLFEAFVRELRPRCSGCGQVLERPASLGAMRLPAEGFLAAVLADDRTDIPILERCEMLGAERVLVDGAIVRAEDAPHGRGEPVLVLMSASHADEFRREAQAWLERGSDLLRILHLAERAAKPTEIGEASASCRCDGCGCAVPVPAKADFAACEPCERCKGRGWLELEASRLTACEACAGFGSTDRASRHDWRGIEWRHVAAIPFGRACEAFGDAFSALGAVCERGFGGYPIGMPTGMLSEGERARVALLNAELSQLREASFVADGAALWSEPPASNTPTLAVFVPEPLQDPRPFKRPSGQGERFTVRDVQQGPLEASEIGAELGGAIAVQGAQDLEGHLVLEEIARTFAKRRKLAHRCSFGTLKSCHYINPLAALPELVGDVIGIAQLISEDFARTRIARERGLEARDFSLATSRYRCAECADDPQRELACPECGGWLVDPSVGSVAFGGVAFGEALRMPLSELGKLLWRSDLVQAVLSALPDDTAQALSLASRSESLSAEELRATYLRAQLAGVLAGLSRPKAVNSVATGMVLVHAPCCIGAGHQRAVWDALCSLNDRGATVVCADVPKALEYCFGSVVRLRVPREGDLSRIASPLYDVRLTRPLTIEVVKA